MANLQQKNVKKAKNYVDEHKKCVKIAYGKLLPYLVREFNLTDEQIQELTVQIDNHDNSKYEPDELVPYANYFFGNKTDEVVSAFKLAAAKHKTKNAHHPEFWEGADMPLNFVIEMVCDWWAFSIAQNNLAKTLMWYEANKQKLNLSQQTTAQVEKILAIIKQISYICQNGQQQK